MGQGVVIHAREGTCLGMKHYEGLSNENRWIISENLVNAIRGALLLKLIVNPSSKAFSINRQISHCREEDNLLGDESPPLESVSDLSTNPRRD
ncbi:unnamed protein product [Spirodela intermedia]|uniref:Uncharacterized protein n=1 Tax=Spirodela intermedia TaxID=51605 RepID=A0A7I8KW61_SPIIN|nr:unnamed protein product [Spirodela intermedia]